MNSVYAGSAQGTFSNTAAYAFSCLLVAASGASVHVAAESIPVKKQRVAHYSTGMTQSSSTVSTNVFPLSDLVIPMHSLIDVDGYDWTDYFNKFARAIEQYESGDLIRIPDEIKSEDEFFDWLKSV